MSSTTAMVFIGSTHPNDGEIRDTHLARLHEGDRAAWVLDRLDVPARLAAWWPADPSRIFSDLLAMVGIHVLQLPAGVPWLRDRSVEPAECDSRVIDLIVSRALLVPGVAASFVISPASSLMLFRTEISTQLDRFDVEVFERRWSRKWNVWAEGWTVA